MIKYLCKNCNGLHCETSICPVCNKRTEIEKTQIFYCTKCNAPSFDEKCSLCYQDCTIIGTDLRPVFPEERLLLEAIENQPFKYAGKSIWNTSGNNYFVDGKKIKFSVKNVVSNVSSADIINFIKKHATENQKYVKNFYDELYIKNFIQINKIRLNSIVNEANAFIKKSADKFSDDSMFVSFSGGKDSTVTSDLVVNALSKQNIIHIYGDTTLEYPETGIYLKKFREYYPKVPMLVAKNKDQNFNELCKVIGPPSRMMRWCCTIFKTGAITRKIDTTFKNKTKVLTFMGIRRNESAARNKYDREGNESKIVKQFTVAPIIDWLDFDIWLYLLSKQIPFNNAYRIGFSRVGCWCCPNNSNWSEFLSSIYMKEEFDKFREVLLGFATDIGKPDPKEYIESGNWKARQGGNGLNYSKNAVVKIKPCVLEENTYNFNLLKPINEMIYELFKPFGKLDYNIGNKRLGEIYILDRKDKTPLIKLSGKIGSSIFKVTILKKTPIFHNSRISEQLIKMQITKFQTCIGCMACESVCKFNALSVKHLDKPIGDNFNIKYTINESKCVGCLECVKHFSNGCYMKKVLRTKKEEE